MSIAFFWDEKQKQFICERRTWDLDFCGRRIFLFVFNSSTDFMKLFAEKRNRIIYDEYGILWTVDLLRHDILNKGVVVFCHGYYGTEDETDDNKGVSFLSHEEIDSDGCEEGDE